MKAWVMLDGAPVAAVERIRADEVERAGDDAPGALAHHQKDAIGHAFADQAEEFAGEVGRPPFARAGIHVEPEERIPVGFGEIAAGDPLAADAALRNGVAFLADIFSLREREAGEKVLSKYP